MAKDHIVASVEDVPEGKSIVVQIGGREFGLFNVRGNYYALPNVCWHQNGPLCRGAISGTVSSGLETDWQLSWVRQGEIVVCPWHSLEFDITSGECLAFPKRSLKAVDVQVRDGQIIIRL